MCSEGGEHAKAGGKKKGKTVPLTDFLKPTVGRWADEDVENDTGIPRLSMLMFSFTGNSSKQT
jgi:hypothetical protein